jgi:peptidoglycan/xylan/chitin deacetylase (PgdA/CDA1 family)
MNEQKLRYVLNEFCMHYELPAGLNLQPNYQLTDKINIQPYQGSFFEENKPIPDKMGEMVWLDRSIPLFFSSTPEKVIEKNGDMVVIQVDVWAHIFYFLSGWQEIHQTQKDEWNRFTYQSSVQEKYGIKDVAIVNYFFDILKTSIELAYDIQIKTKHQFSCLVSHDIDTLDGGWTEGAVASLKKGQLMAPFKLFFKKWILQKDAWFNLHEIIELEKKLDIVSTFFFLTENNIVNKLKNADYNWESNHVQKQVLDIKNQGFEVALHGSLGSSENQHQLKQEFKKIEGKGNRFHFLMFDAIKTPEVLEQIGVKYDASLGFAEHFGFRNGTCYPFHLYNFKEERKFEFVSIPLHAMDTTFYSKKYLHTKPQDVMHKLLPIMDEIYLFNGYFSILWHNNYFSPYKFEGWQEAFVSMVNHLKNHYQCKFKLYNQLKMDTLDKFY